MALGDFSHALLGVLDEIAVPTGARPRSRAAVLVALRDEGIHFVRRGAEWWPREPDAVREAYEEAADADAYAALGSMLPRAVAVVGDVGDASRSAAVDRGPFSDLGELLLGVDPAAADARAALDAGDLDAAAESDEAGPSYGTFDAELAGELTQQELPQRAGVTRQTILSIEKGKYSPTIGLALRLARGVEPRDDWPLGPRIDELLAFLPIFEAPGFQPLKARWLSMTSGR